MRKLPSIHPTAGSSFELSARDPQSVKFSRLIFLRQIYIDRIFGIVAKPTARKWQESRRHIPWAFSPWPGTRNVSVDRYTKPVGCRWPRHTECACYGKHLLDDDALQGLLCGWILRVHILKRFPQQLTYEQIAIPFLFRRNDVPRCCVS